MITKATKIGAFVVLLSHDAPQTVASARIVSRRGHREILSGLVSGVLMPQSVGEQKEISNFLNLCLWKA